MSDHPTLDRAAAREILAAGLAAEVVDGERVLLIVPDDTRSGPLAMLFGLVGELLLPRVARLDVLIALGTHQPMPDAAIEAHLGLGPGGLAGLDPKVRIHNHRWMDPGAFATVGAFSAEETEALSEGRLRQPVQVEINALALDADRLLICGPVFPHEVAGFSGGNKYLFPGIGGPALIDATHWLGALITCPAIIGHKHTPVRAFIDRAAAMVETPRSAICYTVAEGELAGLFVGPVERAWSQAADQSAGLHVHRLAKPVQTVLSIMPRMYDDIWVAAKGMYKLEPVVADGGEVIIYAPHISEISRTHGPIIERIGYHVRDYFVVQWERFEHEPWGVLAHSTHLKGAGTFEGGLERPRVRVSLATGIGPSRCQAVALGHRDPASIDLDAWARRDDPDLLVVPHAGEILYRLEGDGP